MRAFRGVPWLVDWVGGKRSFLCEVYGPVRLSLRLNLCAAPPRHTRLSAYGLKLV